MNFIYKKFQVPPTVLKGFLIKRFGWNGTVIKSTTLMIQTRSCEILTKYKSYPQ